MSYYSQWVKDRKLSQVVWICGAERIIVEEVAQYVQTSRTFNTLNACALDACQQSPAEIWDSLFQRPLMEDLPRLIMVENAQELEDFSRLKDWIKDAATAFPGVVVCFVSQEDTPPEISFFKPPKVTVVRCSKLAIEDSVKWVKRRSSLSERSARMLLDHVAGSLEDAKQVCDKINRCLGQSSLITLTPEQIKSFIVETPSEFTDALMCLDKVRAFISASTLSNDDKYKVVSSLEIRISQLARLQRILKDQKLTGQQLAKIPGIPYPVVKELLPVSKFYSPARILSCRQQLTLVDYYHNQGIYQGTLESLVTLW